MKAVVHIGGPKTGSTSIQAFLFSNTDKLAAQGFRYRRNVAGRASQFEYPLAALASLDKLLPGVPEQIRYSSTDLAIHKATGTAVLAELAANRAHWQEPTALFSSEHILAWLKTRQDVEALDRMFRPHFESVRYVLYIRRQEDLVLSEYSAILKRGSNLRLDDYLGRYKPAMDHEPRVRLWADAVGRDRLDLRLLDPTFLKDADLLADFAAACSISMENLTVPPRKNESLSAPAAECLRMLNERVPQLTSQGAPNPLRKGLVEQLMTMSPPDAARLALSRAQSDDIRTFFAAANRRLCREFFPDRPELFSTPGERPAASQEDILEQALDLAGRLIIRLRMGRMQVLTNAERVVAQQQAPGGVKNGIAPPPKLVPSPGQ